MANATSIDLVAAVANGSVEPTAQVLDTGTDDVVLETPATAEMDRIVLTVTNNATEALVVTASAGEDPPAFRQALGALADVTIAQDETWVLGPFESARVSQADQALQVTFAPGGTIDATFYAVVLPKV
jgi:hypothetical protein